MNRPLRPVDAHQHFWTLSPGHYRWLTPDLGPLYRDFAPDELEPQLKAAGLSATVLVQADDTPEDTASMLALSETHPFIAGVVGWVGLERPLEAEAALERLTRHPKFKGVRHLIHNEPDPDWLLRPAVLDGLRLLIERNLSLDVVAVGPRHLEHVSTLAEALPGLRLVVDHLAKPPINARGWQPWADLIARAAAHPNVYAKLSGLNTAADVDTWTARDLQPYVDHALEVFGPGRLMFGSDWPVAILAGDYAKVWRETNEALKGLSPHERDGVLGGTATAFYRLETELLETEPLGAEGA